MKSKPFRSKYLLTILEWIWVYQSNERSVKNSCILQKKTFYNVRLMCFTISLLTWILSQLYQWSAIITNLQYLTEWGVDLTLLYFGMTLRMMKDKNFAQKYWKVAHIIFEVAYSIQLTINVVYWVTIFPYDTRQKNFYVMSSSITQHGVIFALLIVENILNQIKFYKRHLICLFFFLTVYVIFNMIISLNFTPTYQIVDWKTQKSYVVIALTYALSFLNFFLAMVFSGKFKKYEKM